MKDSYELFCEQLNAATVAYPNLKLKQDEAGISYLKGILDIPNDIGDVAGSFLVEIRFRKGFPFRFPALFEPGGIIPNEADWHKYDNGSCCITVLADEIVKCKNGITVSYFIKKFATSYFANYLYRKQEGKYLNGEYEHGALGIFQFYKELFKIAKMTEWMRYYDYAFKNLKPACGRNDLCLCGAEKKYKYCHLKIFETLKLIGEQQVLNDFKEVINLIKLIA